MRWKKTAVSSSFYITKTVKLWQKKPAMEQSQGISVDLYQYCQANPVGYVDPRGHDVCPTQQSLYKKYRDEGMSAEARGIQYMINNGIDTTDAKQATSHYSCRDCADKQKTYNIINITGEASKQKFGAKIGRKKMEDLW